jgi:hypothetical protein
VPALHNDSGGTVTREDAQCKCMDTLEFALEGDQRIGNLIRFPPTQ